MVVIIRNLLDSNGIAYKYWEHEAVRTSEDAQKLRPDYTMSQGAKALILNIKYRSGNVGFVQCVVPADKKIDSKKLKALLGAKGSRFATVEEANRITNGIEFGGVPPFGNLFAEPLIVYVDESLFGNNEIIFNAGDRRVSIAMSSVDWKSITNPVIAKVI